MAQLLPWDDQVGGRHLQGRTDIGDRFSGKFLLCDGNGVLKTSQVTAQDVNIHTQSRVGTAHATPLALRVQELPPGDVKNPRENVSLNTSGLTTYGASNGTAIDLDGYRHVGVKFRIMGTAGGSSMQNLRLYVSHDNADFTLGDVITCNELPGSTTGNYQASLTLNNFGFRYIRFINIGTTHSPTAVYIHYSRFN